MTDLERLMMQITPMIRVAAEGPAATATASSSSSRAGSGGDVGVGPALPTEAALRALCLEDVWRFYHEPSLFGREVRDVCVCVVVGGMVG